MKNVYEKNVKDFGFSNAHKIILSQIEESKVVLEVGSSSGYLTKVLTENNSIVDIIEVEKEPFENAKKYARNAYFGSIENVKVQDQIKEKYDVIICADVLEHLVNPGDVLDFLRTTLKKDGIILVSIPNVAYWGMRVHLMFSGDFSYHDSGLMDRTHLRFYSLNNFKDLLKSHGLKVIEIYPAEVRVPLENSLNKIPVFGKIVVNIMKGYFAKNFQNLSLYHYVIKATKKEILTRKFTELSPVQDDV